MFRLGLKYVLVIDLKKQKKNRKKSCDFRKENAPTTSNLSVEPIKMLIIETRSQFSLTQDYFFLNMFGNS